MQSANNKLDVETQNQHDVEKALGMVNHEKMQFAEKLKAVESTRQSAEAGLKNVKLNLRTSAKSFTPLNLTSLLSRQWF